MYDKGAMRDNQQIILMRRVFPVPDRLTWVVAFWVLIVLGFPGPVLADQSFEKALSLFEAGEVEDAAAVFQQVWSQDMNAEAGYDLGLCLLHMGLADSAMTVLGNVSEQDKLSPELRRDVLYNLGLATAYSAQARQNTQPGESKALFTKSVESFRDALSFADDEAEFREDTGYNIEAAWRLIEQLEQRMEQQGSSSASDSMANEVEKLAQDQDQVRSRTQEGSDNKELADQQQDLSERASDLSQEMQRRGMDEPAQKMEAARQAQEQAATELEEDDRAGAVDEQDEAMEKLREAMASLLQQTEKGDEQEHQAAEDAKQAAEELARLRREAEKERERREDELKRRGQYRPPVTEKIEVEKNW